MDFWGHCYIFQISGRQKEFESKFQCCRQDVYCMCSSSKRRREPGKKEDRCFVELLYQMLIEIPESEEKAMTMLQIQ